MLGSVTALADGHPVVLGVGRVRQLLMRLLVSVNEPVTVDRLIDGLWPGGPPPSARKNLQVYIHQLRRALGDGRRIVWDGGSYTLAATDDEVDALRFEAIVGQARREVTGPRKSALFGEALALWRGPAYAGQPEPSWVHDEVLRLDELRLTVLEERFEVDLALGRHERLTPQLHALARRYPLRERLTGQLMVALYRNGRQAEALQAYHETRVALANETGLDPSPRLRDLQQAILAAHRGLDLASAEPPAGHPRSDVFVAKHT